MRAARAEAKQLVEATLAAERTVLGGPDGFEAARGLDPDAGRPTAPLRLAALWIATCVTASPGWRCPRARIYRLASHTPS
jgi:hypothetical protein